MLSHYPKITSVLGVHSSTKILYFREILQEFNMQLLLNGCKSILDLPNATSNSVATQEVGVSDTNHLVALAVDVNGLLDNHESSDAHTPLKIL